MIILKEFETLNRGRDPSDIGLSSLSEPTRSSMAVCVDSNRSSGIEGTDTVGLSRAAQVEGYLKSGFDYLVKDLESGLRSDRAT